MNKHHGAVVTRPPTSHPEWCDRSRCLTYPSGPDHAPTTVHASRIDHWATDECRFKLEVIKTDDPYEPGDESRITLSATALCRGVLDNDLMFTVAQATDLIARLQTMVDLARDGR